MSPYLSLSVLFMSCLSISLPPAKKAWKSFTSKLQTRLHKLHKSKAIKKPKNNRLQTAASKTTRPSLFLGQRLQRNRRRRGLPFYVSKNKAAPVYIDKLFKEAPITELVGYYNPQQPSEKSDTVEREKNVKFIDQAAAAGAEAGTSKDGEKQGDEKSSVGDDMWESIGLASPILHGIDARAEEFIASFRAYLLTSLINLSQPYLWMTCSSFVTFSYNIDEATLLFLPFLHA